MPHAANTTNDNIGVAMEVGIHRPNQASRSNSSWIGEAHCFEPSPTSFGACQETIARRFTAHDVRDRTHIYNQAASSTSEGTVQFLMSEGTGDHVGKCDMWRTKQTTKERFHGHVSLCKFLRFDWMSDIVSKQENGVFALKVDAQNHLYFLACPSLYSNTRSSRYRWNTGREESIFMPASKMLVWLLIYCLSLSKLGIPCML